MSNKVKVLSTRHSHLDIASAYLFLKQTGRPTTSVSATISLTLAALMEQLRSAGAIPTPSDSEIDAIIYQLSGGLLVGRDTTEAPRASPTRKPIEPERVSSSLEQSESSPTRQVPEELLQTWQPPAHSFAGLADLGEYEEVPGIEEDIRLQQQLEGEELLSALIVTEHRRDDSHVELIDPNTLKKGEQHATEES